MWIVTKYLALNVQIGDSQVGIALGHYNAEHQVRAVVAPQIVLADRAVVALMDALADDVVIAPYLADALTEHSEVLRAAWPWLDLPQLFRSVELLVDCSEETGEYSEPMIDLETLEVYGPGDVIPGSEDERLPEGEGWIGGPNGVRLNVPRPGHPEDWIV